MIGEERIPLNTSQKFGIRINYGGNFKTKGNTVIWDGGNTVLNFGNSFRNCNFHQIDRLVSNAILVDRGYKIWYRRYGKSLATGRKVLMDDKDVEELLSTLDKIGMVNIYVVFDVEMDGSNMVDHRESLPTLGWGVGVCKVNASNPQKESSSLKPNITKKLPIVSKKNPTKYQPKRKLNASNYPRFGAKLITATEFYDRTPIIHSDLQDSSKKSKWKNVVVEEDDDYTDDESNFYSQNGSSDSDVPSLDEQDYVERGGEDIFSIGLDDTILDGVATSLGLKRSGVEACSIDKDWEEGRSAKQLEKDLEGGFNVEDELQFDSDDAASTCDFDGEIVDYPVFNPEVDFNYPINLRVGLKFPTVEVLRKALRQHAIEKKYDFYFLHNGKTRVTTYCKYRCSCPWNPKRSTRVKCTCGKKICKFKVLALKVRLEETMQIRTAHLKHTCMVQVRSRKLTAEYLAEKYLEDWRSNLNWHLVKGFGKRVFLDTGIYCGYYKLWYARARAKIMLYGDGADQYKRVWDYTNAVKQYNVGSSAICSCNNIERPPPIFQRMFICLKPIMKGFKKGCRPIIGLDGCHLTGSYPGICLTAVASDGNNNIYPLAWAVVDIEKTDTWTWFIDLLASALGTLDGQGYTFMSDRQKGLLDAFHNVVPKAEIRFCWRHLWCNFKNKWNGEAYKDILWLAAKATTLIEFEKQMECLKFLSVPAYNYMASIPSKCWSRHAFSTNCKSKMLLNNTCESFNNVLRDKPILTHMEWMRRYVMQRNCSKRECVHKIEGKFLPYVDKQFEWCEKQRPYCTLIPSSPELFEVEYYSDRFIVDLNAKTCSCYSWELTGIPCHHAYAIILYMRGDPYEFVEDWYSKERYMATYAPIVKPMPSPKEWERTPFPQHLPPPFKKMPGRPSKKKRKKEIGEDEENAKKKGVKPTKCSNCRQLGHNKKTCNNPTVPPSPKKKGGKALSKDPWAIHNREKMAKGKGKGKKKQQRSPTTIEEQVMDISSQASKLDSS